LVYREIPRFTPSVSPGCTAPAPAVQTLSEGLDQLLQEAWCNRSAQGQFSTRATARGGGAASVEVVKYRMHSEYGADSRLEQGLWKVLRWIAMTRRAPLKIHLATGSRLAFDVAGKRSSFSRTSGVVTSLRNEIRRLVFGASCRSSACGNGTNKLVRRR